MDSGQMKIKRALAQAVLKLNKHPDQRRTMGDRARQLVLEHFSQHQIIGQTLALYRESLGRP